MSKYYLTANKTEVDFVSTYFKYTSNECVRATLLGYADYLYINTDSMTYTFRELLSFNEMAEYKFITIDKLQYITRDHKIDEILNNE